MEKGSDYLDVGKKALVFTKESHVDGDYLMLELTPQFIQTWKHTINGHQYQKDFRKYILLALMKHNLHHYNMDDDTIIGLACVIDNMKETLFKNQMTMNQFEEGDGEDGN